MWSDAAATTADGDRRLHGAALRPPEDSDEINDRARKAWMNGGGELISLPADEQSAMLEIMASVGEDVSKTKPQLSAAYLVATEGGTKQAIGRKR